MSRGDVVTFSVFGPPRPAPRPRFGVRGRPVSTPANKQASFWAGCVQRAARGAKESLGGEKAVKTMLDGHPLLFQAEFRIPTKDASRWGKLHWETTPDLDNLVKLALDNILVDPKTPGSGLMEASDARICAFDGVRKIWSSPKKAGATFRLSRLDPATNEVAADVKPWWL